MCCVESEQEQIAKERMRACERGAIRVVNERETAFTHFLFELSGNFAQRGRVDLIKSPASSAQFVDRAKKTIGVPSDRFCDEYAFVIAVFACEFFGSGGQNKAQMLPQRQAQITPAKQNFPQLWRRKKFHAEQRFTFGEQAASKKISLAARCCYNSGGLCILQSASGDFLEPEAY